MIYLNPGSQTYELIRILALTGEFPFRSLRLFGNRKTWKELVYRLMQSQEFAVSESGERLCCRLLTVSGKGRYRTIRLYKRGLPVLRAMLPEAYAFYCSRYGGSSFSGGRDHLERNHLVAEAVLMLIRSGVAAEPYSLPALQNDHFSPTVPDFPCFYFAREIKQTGTPEQNKTMFTRLVGALFAGDTCYAVYNTRDKQMKWSGAGELKANDALRTVCRFNTGSAVGDRAVLFGSGAKAAIETLQESVCTCRRMSRFDSIYPAVHFVPLDESGLGLLELLLHPETGEKILQTLFSPEIRSYRMGEFDYDAKVGRRVFFSHLDGDLARLIRFWEATRIFDYDYLVLCHEFQQEYVRAFLGPGCQIRTVDPYTVRKMAGLA